MTEITASGLPMTLATRFRDSITTEAELRDVLGHPSEGAAGKSLPFIDEHFAGFIAQSPFVLIASSDAFGNMDISPKGDPPGFVRLLDEHTLAIPDRPGNRRGDTFSNILQQPNVALYFLVPGIRDTLRVQGRALIVRDTELRESMTINGRTPNLAIVVEVEDAFMHCAKCVVRSHLWEQEAWPDPAEVPSLSAALVSQKNLDISKEKFVALLEKEAKEHLY